MARSIFSNQEVQSTPCSEHFWKLGRGKNGRSLWCEACFQIKKYKAHHDRSTLGSWGVEKWQVIVARSMFSNQEIQNTPCSEHFWKLRCGKMAGHCGAKRTFKTRNTKHTMLGALLEVGVWKNGRSLWCEAYFQIKKYKTHHARSTFGSWGVKKWQVTVERSIFSNQEIKTHHVRSTLALLEVGAWKNGRSLWCEAYFQTKKYKAHHARSTFGSWGAEEWQVTVGRNIFSNQEIQSTPCSEHFWKLGRGKMAGHCGAKRISNQEIQNTPCSEHFWKLGCGKMAGHCGARRILKTRNTKHTMLGALLEVEVRSNGRSLWREAYFQIKRYKAHHARSTLGSWGVEKWQVTVVRSIFSN